MLRFSLILLSLIGLYSGMSGAATLDTARPGDIINAKLKDLHPTQASVGFDQVLYKLGRFQADKEKLFDEICEVNGQEGVARFSSTSRVTDPSSFQCEEAVGSEPSDMKTVVIGPDKQLYLTDGHHTFNVFWHMPDGGADYTVNVVVTDDYSNLSMDAFWKTMENSNNTWLFDEHYAAMPQEALPASLGLQNFRNNLYRSLAYFSREIAWDKPKPAINFVEFYWGKAVHNAIDLYQYDLSSQDGYKKAVKDFAHAVLAVKGNNVGGIGKTAQQMGQYNAFDEEAFNELFEKNEKIDYLLRYKAQLSQQLNLDTATRHNNAMTYVDGYTLAGTTDLMSIPPTTDAGNVNAVIEIPTGTQGKWELNKDDTREIAWEIKEGKPRVVQFLGYPGNYGFIPGTALPKELGGDGDPLDVLVLGQAVNRGHVLPVRLIGVLKLLDSGEQDDKLIAVMTNDNPFANVTSLAQLQTDYPGLTDIIQLWFSHYKGPNGGMQAQGFGDQKQALSILQQAISAYQAE